MERQEVAVFAGKSWEEWLQQYERSHQHPVNRWCHTIGIPLIAASLPPLTAALFIPRLWMLAVPLFALGWIFQFLGHWVEGKPPELFRDWRFMFVGLRWWFARIRGRL